MTDVEARVATAAENLLRECLQDWETARGRFSLILPRDYQRVLDVRAAAEAEGLDLDGTEVWDQIMEASRG